MKTWTVVVEVQVDDEMDRNEVENRIRAGDEAFNHYRIMESIPAPYGAQHPDGVFIKEVKKS